MSKTWYPPGGSPILPQNNATTVGPQVARVITPCLRLEELVHCGVFSDSGRMLRIYRRSSMDLGTLSCEVYRRQGSGWSRPKKEKVKYAPPDDLFPPSAQVVHVDGVPCGSLEPITPEQVEVLRRLLRPV